MAVVVVVVVAVAVAAAVGAAAAAVVAVAAAVEIVDAVVVAVAVELMIFHLHAWRSQTGGSDFECFRAADKSNAAAPLTRRRPASGFASCGGSRRGAEKNFELEVARQRHHRWTSDPPSTSAGSFSGQCRSPPAHRRVRLSALRARQPCSPWRQRQPPRPLPPDARSPSPGTRGAEETLWETTTRPSEA